MKKIQQLIAELWKQDIKLRIEGDQLHYSAPEQALTPALLERMKKSKNEIIAYLNQTGPQPIKPGSRGRLLPLSFAQQRLWFLDQLEEDSFAYNIPIPIHIEGQLDTNALEMAFKEVLRRHEVLRTRFPAKEGTPVQVIHPVPGFCLPVIDLQDLTTEEERRAKVKAMVIEDARSPFDLASGPILRSRLLRLASRSHALLLTTHHIVIDGWSIRIFLHELSTLYGTFSGGEPVFLQELPVQYADYSAWQQDWMNSPPAAAQLAYWKQQLAGAPTFLQFPTTHPRPARQTFNGRTQCFEIPRSLRTQLEDLACHSGASMFMVLFAAFALLLYGYSSQQDILVGTSIANRIRKETESLIGLFANTIVLRTDLSGDPTFPELLDRIRRMTLDAYANQDIPFERVVEEVQPQRSLSFTPLFQVMFELQEMPFQAREIPGLEISIMELENVTAKFDLILSMLEDEKHLVGTLEYNTDLFDNHFIEQIAGHYMEILKQVTDTQIGRISRVSLLGTGERHQLLEEWNRTGVDFPGEKFFPCLFAGQVEKTPDAVTALYRGEHLTYRELSRQSRKLAGALAACGVGVETIVAVLAERSIEFLIAILGIFTAGGAYLPLDPKHPAKRRAQVLGQGTPSLLLMENKFHSPLHETLDLLPSAINPAVFLIEKLLYAGKNPGHPPAALSHHCKPGNLAYVIFTSGSTGVPKGAMVEHRGMCNHLFAKVHDLTLTYTDKVAQNASQCFDISVWQFLAPLLVGGSVVICPHHIAMDPVLLLRELDTVSVTALEVVPSFLEVLLEEIGRNPVHRLSSLRWLIPTGEALTPRLAHQWLRNFPGIPLLNAYGPTECSDDVTHYPFTRLRPDLHNVPIGRPVANMRLYVLNAFFQPVPVWVPGELYVTGLGMGRGYLNAPGKTANVFLPCPFSRQAGEVSCRMYKTGDRVRYRPDGNLEFLGRTDFQVKIRGFRIELGEIDTVLTRHPAIQEAVVMVREDNGNHKYLCAYITPGGASQKIPDSKQLQEYLSGKLPDHMIPSAFVPMEKFPLTPNGKIDRKKLPIPVISREKGTPENARYPADEREILLMEIWREVLGLTNIGIDDNFFQVGGHSLRAINVVSKIKKSFQVEVPLQVIFEKTSIREQLNYIKHARISAFGAIESIEKKDYYPLSAAQRRLFALYQFDKDGLSYNLPYALSIEGKLSMNRLWESFKQLIRRHESLRTSFHLIDGQAVQRIHHEVEFNIEWCDSKPSVSKTSEPHPGFINDFIRPFDLSRAPLLRMRLVKKAGNNYILLVDMHHIVSDGVSLGIFVNEFTRLYKDRALNPLYLQYKDFAAWQNTLLQGEQITRQKAYWMERFPGEIPVLDMPLDYPRPMVQSFEGDTLGFEINEASTRGLHGIAGTGGATLYMVLLAVFYILLHKYSHQDDIIIGSFSVGRRRADLDSIVGMFVNTLTMRNYPTPYKSFDQFLKEVRKNCIQAFENQDYQFDQLVEELDLKRDVRRNPLFDILFALQNVEKQELEIEDLKFRPYELKNSISKFDINLQFWPHNHKLYASLQYCVKLFKKETMERLTVHFMNIVKQVIKNPGIKLGDIGILTGQEKKQFLYEFNATRRDYPWEKTIHQLFREQVERTPDCIAVTGAGREWRGITYRLLNEKSNRVAHLLQNKGVTTDTVAAIMVERSIQLIIGILGILKAGGAYLPIDTHYPEERKKYMLKDSNAGILLTHKDITPSPSTLTSTLACQVSSTNLAYVIYTSGSTGNPKGVMLDHRNVVNYTWWAIKHYVKNESVNFPLFSSLSFDLTVTSIFTPLLSGNTIVVYKEEGKESLIQRVIEDNLVGVVKLTPSHLKLTAAHSFTTGVTLPSGIKRFIVGGDVLETKLAGKIVEIFNEDIVIYNEYGPTETTVGCMIYPFSPGTDTRQSVPIGIPADNVQVYLLDRSKHPLPMGAAGEIYVSGDGVARGYLNNQELTAGRFIKNPFLPGKRMYKTGDLARFLPGENIEFLGRLDQQVKIRGFRIEPGEIESKLKEYRKNKSITVPDKDFRRIDSAKNQLCQRCLLPSSYPGIHFDEKGVCNICLEFEGYKDKVKSYFKDKKDFVALVEEIQGNNRGEYDCLLLYSGGKDSTYVLYQLIDMGLKVLTFTFDNGYISDAAFANIKRITSALEVKNIVSKARNMNKVFVESLNTNHDVCHGCWNALNTFGAKTAHENGINLVISGLSRGQIFEMRLEGLFRQKIFDEEEIEENLQLFRKSFHSNQNKFARLLEVELAEEVLDQVYFVDFFRYFDAPVSGIKTYLSQKGWVQPADTGFCSSNCTINDVGIYFHLKKQGYHFYAPQLSWDCRLGSIPREVGLKDTVFEGDKRQIYRILKEIGYYRPPVEDAVVIDREDKNGDRILIAYFVSNRQLDVSELREYLAGQMPDYMIPAYFVQVEKIPLTPGGKVDKRALPGAIVAVRQEYTSPRDMAEEKLAGLWAKVIGMDKSSIGIDTNFFELGGDSLKAMVLTANIHKEFNVRIPNIELYKLPTIRKLSAYINQLAVDEYNPIKSIEKKEYYKLSPAQKKIYYFQQLDPGGLVCNVPLILIMEGKIKKEKINAVFKKIISRHESLRTSFEMTAVEPVQRIHKKVEFEIEYFDSVGSVKWAADSRGDLHHSSFIAYHCARFIRPIKISKAPLMHVALVKIEEEKHILATNIHHIISDGVSTDVFIKEFSALYQGWGLPELRLQYKDYSGWQNQNKEKEATKQQEAYWLNLLAGELPSLDLPTDYTRPKQRSFEGSSTALELDRKESGRLNQLALKEKTTLFMVVFAVINVFLSKLTGNDEIIIGTDTSGRAHADLQHLIGMFANTLVLRNYPKGEKTFKTFLQEIKKRVLEAFENQDYTFEDLKGKLKITRDTNRHPLFDVMFFFQNYTAIIDVPEAEIPRLKLESYTYKRKTSMYDFTIACFESRDKLLFVFEYCTKLFKKETIARFRDFFKKLISVIVDAPGKKIGEIEFYSSLK